MTGVLAPLLRQHCGLGLSLKLERRGYSPHGRGQVTVEIGPSRPGNTHKPLHSIDLSRRGTVVRIDGVACVGGGVDRAEAQAMATAVADTLLSNIGTIESTWCARATNRTDIDIPISIAVEADHPAVAPGGGVTVWATTGATVSLPVPMKDQPAVLDRLQ